LKLYTHPVSGDQPWQEYELISDISGALISGRSPQIAWCHSREKKAPASKDGPVFGLVNGY
jgi:hypothetical protein